MIKYNQITLKEREKMYQLLKADTSLTKIASLLGRHKSTISREINRNSSPNLGYLPDSANNRCLRRKQRQIYKLEKHPELKNYVVSKLAQHKWSPEMIAGRLAHEKNPLKISHEAIYQYIYSFHGQKQRLYQYLMYARPKRHLKFSRRHRYRVPERCRIANRPNKINERKAFGHFEGDLTFFKGSKNGNLAVLTERVSRKSFLIKNYNKKSVKIMLNISKTLKQLPKGAVKSVTFDNGGEFKQFGLLSFIGARAYFCDPGAPYQKGQVERTNAILHKFIPKKSDFNFISDDLIKDAEEKLNNLPKKCLNFLTPNEVWDNLSNSNIVALHS